MSICDKFDDDSKRKMKKMIFRHRITGFEYCTIIKKDYTLGKIARGSKHHSKPNLQNYLIESLNNNIIGEFHTHYYGPIEYLTYFKSRKVARTLLDKHTLLMSKDDIKSVIIKRLDVECIGSCISGKYIVSCRLIDKEVQNQYSEIVMRNPQKWKDMLEGEKWLSANQEITLDECRLQL